MEFEVGKGGYTPDVVAQHVETNVDLSPMLTFSPGSGT